MRKATVLRKIKRLPFVRGGVGLRFKLFSEKMGGGLDELCFKLGGEVGGSAVRASDGHYASDYIALGEDGHSTADKM